MEERHQLALDCLILADEIDAFAALRPDASSVDEVSHGHTERLVAESTAFADDLSIQFAERLQHLLIRLREAGFGTDALDPLTYDGTSRLGARHAAETLQAIARDLMIEPGLVEGATERTGRAHRSAASRRQSP